MANEGTTVANEGTTMANEGTSVAKKGTEIKAKVRVFFWNEKLTRNQISESEGLCVIIIRRSYKWLHECPRIVCYPQASRWYDTYSSTVIPFDLSRLLNKDPSLFSMILSATLQFNPEDIIQISNEINSELFTKFRLFSKPQPRPPYVIALEISQFDIIGFSSYYSVPPFPPIPSFSRFVKDWDDEEELLTAVRSLSTTDYINDPYHKYLGDVLEYIHALREYTGEGGICPAKPPIAEDLPKGLNEIACSPSPTPVFNDHSRGLMDDTCPVCYEDFKDENEVITTNCLHEFHIHCMIKWLSMHNTCPTCRADYPLHYSPLSNCRKRPHHNILEEPNCKRQHIGGASTFESNV